MSVLTREYIKTFKNNLIFIISYTLIFILIYKTFKYISPFFIGAVIALLINPISNKLKKKFNIDKGVSTIVLSFIAVILFISLVAAMVITSIDNILAFINNFNYEQINEVISKLNININTYLQQLKNIPSIDVQGLFDTYSSNLLQISKNMLQEIIELFSSIPYIAIFTMTLFMATYFIAKDIDRLEYKFYNIFTEPTKTKVKNVKSEIIKSTLGYIRAYTILMGITFLITWLTLRFFKVQYAFVLGGVAGILDLIPFLGIVVIYLPIIIYYFIINEKILAIILSIIFLLLSILRQILEPKLVSTNIGISPLSTLAAIFIGVQAKGVIGIVFFLGFITMHKILKKVSIL